MACHCNFAIEIVLDQVVRCRLEEPVESATVTFWVVLVDEENLDAKRPRPPDLVREVLAVFAHERRVVEVQQHVGHLVSTRLPV